MVAGARKLTSNAPVGALGVTSLLDYTADLEGELRALPERPVVIGHSMGGLIALMLCARGLARAGVLLTPAAPASVIAIRPSNLACFGGNAEPATDTDEAERRFSGRAGDLE